MSGVQFMTLEKVTNELLTFNKILLLWHFVTSFNVWSKTLKIGAYAVFYFTQFLRE